MKKILLLAVIMVLSFEPVCQAQYYNTNTDWLAEAYFGVDGPAPPVNIPQINPDTWNEDMNKFDVEKAVSLAAETGASYMMVNATQIDGYFIAPNDKYDEIT